MEVASLRRTSRPLLLVAATVLSCATLAGAEERVALIGRVSNEAGGPLPNALVAVFDDSNHVVDYARTDDSGGYQVLVPQHVLHLGLRHGKSLFGEVVGPVTRVVGGTLRVIGVPLRAGVNAVSSAESANLDPVSRGGAAAGTAVADSLLLALTPRQKRAVPLAERKLPGRLLVKVVGPERNDLVGVASVFWLERAEADMGGRRTQVLEAWVDPIKMNPDTSDEGSSLESRYLRFVSPRLEPSIAAPGERVRMSVRLPAPRDPDTPVVVVARNAKTGESWELQRADGDRYECEILVGRHSPRDDQPIEIVAYQAQDGDARRRMDVEGRIQGRGLWDPKRPYLYDPMLVASRNRADLVLTVLPPGRGRRD